MHADRINPELLAFITIHSARLSPKGVMSALIAAAFQLAKRSKARATVRLLSVAIGLLAALGFWARGQEIRRKTWVSSWSPSPPD